jgi:hypothetical protein
MTDRRTLRRRGAVTLRRTRSSARWVTEVRFTRDLRVPVVAGDEDFCAGWASVPQAPDGDPNWEVFDTRSDRKTGWRRVRRLLDS